MKILLVEDEPAIREPLARLLTSEGWQVLCAGTQAQALERVGQNTLDAALIDLGLPDGDGFAVSRAVRAAGDAAILILTVRTDEWSAVQSLEGGADDYIEKPFRARELIARLRAVQRRRAQNGKERYACRGLEVDLRMMQAFLNGTPLELTAQEYRLLRIFLTHAGQVLERGQLLQLLWDQGGNYVNDNTLTVTVKRLREKLEQAGQGTSGQLVRAGTGAQVRGRAEPAVREEAGPPVQGRPGMPAQGNFGVTMQEEPGPSVQGKSAPPEKPFITTVRGAGYRWEGEVYAKP